MIRPDWHTIHQDNGGGSYTTIVQRGQNVDCSLSSVPVNVEGEEFTHSTEMDFGTFTKHPKKILLHNSRTPLRVERPEGTRFLLRPIRPNTVHAVVSGSTAYYAQFWSGIDCTRIVTPEGVNEYLSLTSVDGNRVVEWSVVGDMVMEFPPFYEVEHEQLGVQQVGVSYTFNGDTLAYDLTVVPVGSVVQTWLR